MYYPKAIDTSGKNWIKEKKYFKEGKNILNIVSFYIM